MIRLKYRSVYQLLKNTSHFSCILNKVLLPDHDFTVGARHKLIPSVIAVMEILPKNLTGDAVTCNGPTYIATRSGKPTGSSAFHHLTDTKRVRSLTEFEGSEEWKVEHIRESQYFLQIVKCLDSNCCTPFRSSFLTVVKRLTNEKWAEMGKRRQDWNISLFASESYHECKHNSTYPFPEIPYDVANPAVQDQLKTYLR